VRYGNTVSLPSERRQRRSSAYEGSLIDAIDRRILIELQDDGRVTMAELGRRVSLSAPAVGERVQRLEESGVITGYSAVVDPRAIGYPIAALVRIRPARRQLHKVPEVARSTPEVVECHRVTGEDCYVAKLHLRSMDDLEGILDRFAAVGQTTTSIVHSAPVAARPLPLLDGPEGG
jgi:Lrp/AsnC family transcriptional regulator, leucine-responsive regulatory protein